MNKIEFEKYHGTGNDFVMIDDRRKQFAVDAHEIIARICHRRFGVGADGLILIRNHSDADFEMIYFNSDGHLTTLCGNGSRCAVQFASTLGMIGNSCTFMTTVGQLHGSLEKGLVSVKMQDAVPPEEHRGHFFVNTGSPHHICFVDDVQSHDVQREGRNIRNSAAYGTAGCNVNFVQKTGRSELFVRTYERGVEDETLSCGTGVVAAALAGASMGLKSPVHIKTRGGKLRVNFDDGKNGAFTNIILTGPAEFIFRGEFAITEGLI
jgi:diaminopimelate epimerase